MKPRGSPSKNRDALIGRATSLEDIIGALAKRGCSDLTASINLGACSELPLAGGGFCDVFQGRLNEGTKVAIKSLRVYDRPGRDNDKQKVLKRAAREIYHWSRLNHPNVLPLKGLAIFRGHMSMVSQWMDNGDLMSYIRLKPDSNRIGLCIDVCAGLCHIHTKGMVHGDLKAANVMVSLEGVAMIADFGNSQLKDLTLQFTNTTNLSHSIRWTAPELLREDDSPHVSKEADVYAYGMTALETLTSKVPFDGLKDNRVMCLVAYEHRVPSRPDAGISDDLWSLMESCWNCEPAKRPTIERVKERIQVLNDQDSGQPQNCITLPVRQSEVERVHRGEKEERHPNESIMEIGQGPTRIVAGPPHFSAVPRTIVPGPPPAPPIPETYTPYSLNRTGAAYGNGVNKGYSYAAATPATPVTSQLPPGRMPSPEPWHDPFSPRRRADADNAAVIAHKRALEQARKLAAGESDDEDEEESVQRLARSRYGDQNYSDEDEEESEENTLGPSHQVPTTRVGALRRPPVSREPPPQQTKGFPLVRPNSSFTDRNRGKTRAQVEAFHALRDQQNLERQRQWDVDQPTPPQQPTGFPLARPNSGFTDRNMDKTRAQVEAFHALRDQQDLERQRQWDVNHLTVDDNRPPSPQGSVRGRKFRTVTVVSTSDEEEWTTGR